MREEIREVVTSISNRYVRKWKEEGKKVIGYPCTYVPAEIISAAGMLPFRMRAVEIETTSIGDSYFGPVVCSFPKGLLQMAGEGKYSFLDGALVCNGCDTMRRLDECWRKANDDIRGILPSFFHHFASPHKVTEYGVKWFADEVRLLISALEGKFGVRITNEALREEIRKYNRSRSLLEKLDELRMRVPAPISGTDAIGIAIAGTAMPVDEFNPLLEQIIAELEVKKDGLPGKRLLLAGSILDDLDLLQAIEDEGAVIVADALCFGSRSHVDLVDEKADPVEALARRYLDAILCPRMFGGYRKRYSYLLDRARKAKVDGAILQNVRFCDLCGSENGIYERDLEALGIPCMRMEREYGPLGDEGRVRMRVDAFLERIS